MPDSHFASADCFLVTTARLSRPALVTADRAIFALAGTLDRLDARA